MKKIFILENTERTYLEIYLGEINHSIMVIEQNINNTECIAKEIEKIKSHLETSFNIVKE